ncbi:MAG: tryptophan 7-halogenase [Saprospiraceae bacterium]|nr:tryptophan 7-halogenase [Saprospiraceae bacterium]
MKKDVIIIGGGPTGSSLAINLAREGLDVQILEKAKFPREHVGESMLPYCYHIFEELGVLDKMKQNFSRKPGVTFSNPDGSQASHWCFDKVVDGPSSLSFHARRSEFDQMMLDHARSEGVDAQEEMQVMDVDLNAPGGGVLVKALHQGNKEVEISGRFLVDATGQDCFLSRKLGNQKRFETLNIRLALSAHWTDVKLTPSLANGNITIVHIGGEKSGWIWLIPLNDDRLSIGLAINMDYAQEQRKSLMKEHGVRNWQKELYLQEINNAPLVKEIIQNGSMAWEVVSNGDFSYYAEAKFGPNHAILGDAAAFLDPIFSSGIFLGMHSSKTIAPGIVAMLQKGDPSLIESGYKSLEGGYRVIEELISAFYDPEAINFPELSVSDGMDFNQMESAYTVYHMLLAGDFFNDSERYLKAISALRDSSMIEKYKNLKGHADEDSKKLVCAINPILA